MRSGCSTTRASTLRSPRSGRAGASTISAFQAEDEAELAELKARGRAADRTLLDEGETVCCYAHAARSSLGHRSAGDRVGALPDLGRRRAGLPVSPSPSPRPSSPAARPVAARGIPVNVSARGTGACCEGCAMPQEPSESLVRSLFVRAEAASISPVRSLLRDAPASPNQTFREEHMEAFFVSRAGDEGILACVGLERWRHPRRSAPLAGRADARGTGVQRPGLRDHGGLRCVERRESPLHPDHHGEPFFEARGFGAATARRYRHQCRRAADLRTCVRPRLSTCSKRSTPLPPPRNIVMAEKTYNVLFICTGNSARSISGRGPAQPPGRRAIQGPTPLAATQPARSTPTLCSLWTKCTFPPPAIVQQGLGRIREAGCAGDGLRSHRLRQGSGRGVSGVARPADDRALGRGRPCSAFAGPEEATERQFMDTAPHAQAPDRTDAGPASGPARHDGHQARDPRHRARSHEGCAMTLNVLILCTHNSARSVLAEGMLNHWARKLGKDVKAFSAGSAPSGKSQPVRHRGVEGRRRGHRRLPKQELGRVRHGPVMHVVITVCDSAAQETCPYWPGTRAGGPLGISGPVQRRRRRRRQATGLRADAPGDLLSHAAAARAGQPGSNERR